MSYQSPFSERYGSQAMRDLWSESSKRRAWRRVWVAVAEALSAAGRVQPEQLDDLRARAQSIDLARALALEAEIGHDLVAELRAYAEQCPVGGPVLHWGLTSADVEDNADVVRQKAALALLLAGLRALLLVFAGRIEDGADLAVLGYTHLQPAEPTTLGYRLAVHAQDLLGHFEALAALRAGLRGKGIKGAVGTSAQFVDLLEGTPVTPETLEATVMEALGLEAVPASGQTYPRVQDFSLLSALAGLAASLHKLALDLRLMQSPAVGVAAEPFGAQQVGSSAMPFKRNPVLAERICSLARLVAAAPPVAWQNAAHTMLERSLDDSANRRSLIPEAFLACDEMLALAARIVDGLEIDEQAASEALRQHAPLAATERVLNALVLAGADRQEMHARLREHTLAARQAQRPSAEALADRLCADTALLRHIQPAHLRQLLDAGSFLGRAPQRAREMARRIRDRLGDSRTADLP